MQENIENINVHDEESLSIDEILKSLFSVLMLCKKNAWRLLIIGFLGAGIGYYIANLGVPIYSARIKFIVREQGNNSSLISSLGNLGSLIGGGTVTASPMDRTLAILGSERIVGTILLKPIRVGNKMDLSINHVIQIYDLKKTWEKDSSLNNVHFQMDNLNLDSFSISQRKVYKKVLSMFIDEKSKLLSKSFDKLSGIFEAIVQTPNEEFSIEFCKLIYKELEQFMYKQSLTSSSKNINILTEKVDSIKMALNGVQNALARNTDRTLGLLMQEDKVEQKKLIIKEQMLTIMYGEAQKNLETFKFVNESINTGLEAIESPISPLTPTEKNRVSYALFGFVLFSFLCFLVIFILNKIKLRR